MRREALRISRSHFPVTALGPGTRLGVWVQGCPLACKGCMAQDTWAPQAGVEADVEALAERWREAITLGATGLTVSGGEPLAQPGPLRAFLEAAHRVRSEFQGEFDILMFTGYELEELDEEQRPAAAMADVLVTGRYRVDLPTRLVWRGSANQQMILQSDLGLRRYATHVDERPEKPLIQISVGDGGAWIIGVPVSGTLALMDKALRDQGIETLGVSWRTPRRVRGEGDETVD